MEQVQQLKAPVFVDERGWFRELQNLGLMQQVGVEKFAQTNVSKSRAMVFRGLHWQVGEHSQGKLVSVLSGSISDFVVDLRMSSAGFGRLQSFDLSAEAGDLLWVPPGFAHGFLALEENTLVAYSVTTPWHKDSERSTSIRSERFNFQPPDAMLMSNKDEKAPDFDSVALGDFFA